MDLNFSNSTFVSSSKSHKDLNKASIGSPSRSTNITPSLSNRALNSIIRTEDGDEMDTSDISSSLSQSQELLKLLKGNGRIGDISTSNSNERIEKLLVISKEQLQTSQPHSTLRITDRMRISTRHSIPTHFSFETITPAPLSSRILLSVPHKSTRSLSVLPNDHAIPLINSEAAQPLVKDPIFISQSICTEPDTSLNLISASTLAKTLMSMGDGPQRFRILDFRRKASFDRERVINSKNLSILSLYLRRYKVSFDHAYSQYFQNPDWRPEELVGTDVVLMDESMPINESDMPQFLSRSSIGFYARCIQEYNNTLVPISTRIRVHLLLGGFQSFANYCRENSLEALVSSDAAISRTINSPPPQFSLETSSLTVDPFEFSNTLPIKKLGINGQKANFSDCSMILPYLWLGADIASVTPIQNTPSTEDMWQWIPVASPTSHRGHSFPVPDHSATTETLMNWEGADVKKAADILNSDFSVPIQLTHQLNYIATQSNLVAYNIRYVINMAEECIDLSPFFTAEHRNNRQKNQILDEIDERVWRSGGKAVELKTEHYHRLFGYRKFGCRDFTDEKMEEIIPKAIMQIGFIHHSTFTQCDL